METDDIPHVHYICPQANPLTPIPGPRARLGAAMAAEATTAVHGWPSYHASNLLGPRRMIHGRTRGYLKNTKHTSAMERLRDKSGYDHEQVPYGQTIALAAGG